MGESTKKVHERRLKWYGHVMIREEHYAGRVAMVMKVQWRRKSGRPNRRWLEKVKNYIKEKGLSADDVYDRAYVIVHRPHIKVGIRLRRRSRGCQLRNTHLHSSAAILNLLIR